MDSGNAVSQSNSDKKSVTIGERPLENDVANNTSEPLIKIREEYMEVERMAMKFLENKLGKDIRKDVSFRLGNKRIYADGIIEQTDSDIIIEVKYFKSHGNVYQRTIPMAFMQMEEVKKHYRHLFKKSCSGILLIVHDSMNENSLKRIQEFVDNQLKCCS